MVTTAFISYERSVPEALEKAGLASLLPPAGRVLIKPNLLQDAPPPVTTHVECVEALVRFIRENSPSVEIVVAEGSGGCDTWKAFDALGYRKLSAYGVRLVDLDGEPVKEYRVPHALQWETLTLPALLEDAFLVSAAVLKHHTITRVTLSLKNLIGILPADFYGGYWSYRKSMVHKDDVEKVIHDIHRVRRVDFALIDAAVGQEGSHLRGGRPFDPPVGKIVAAADPVEADSEACRLLDVEPDEVEHIRYCRAVYRHG